MEQYDGLFPSAYVDSSSSLLVPNGTAQGERPRARRRRRRAPRCGGELDGGGDPKKRRLSDKQVEMLELSFREERKLETGRKVHLATELGLDPKQVAVWFQNRRTRHNHKLLEEEFAKLKQAHDAAILHKCHLEEEFAKLKQAHDAAILHKCHLENEVMRLKERLVLAEEELTRFRSAGSHAVSGDGGEVMGRAVCSGSPSTCHQMSVDVRGGDHPGNDDQLLYVPEYAYADNSVVEWFSLYGLM